MALAETAKLTVQLNLKDGLTSGLNKATASLKRFDFNAGKIGNLARSGLSNAVGNLAKLGAVAGVGIAAMVKSGIQDLATLESAVTSVDGAIKQMGLTGKVTGAQIADWANQIESDIGAAFDDKAITQATTTLIRFGKVTEANIRPAMQIIADLATKTGDVDSAASLLAKALADPTKAAGKLARSGVVLTKQQQKQIAKFMEMNDLASAQAVVLDAVAESTKGAAAASQGPYQRALSVLGDVAEDARKALAEGFLPVIERVAKVLSTELAKPETMRAIRAFGQDLAVGFDKLLSIAQRLPWDSIGASLKLAGAGARTILEAFASLPPWVQTAVLTGWGLNKLTGGALGGIVAELGKGLIKGVLNMNAGVVNLRAGSVIGGGGSAIPGGKGGGVGKAGGALVTGRTFITGIAAGVLAGLAVELAGELGAQSTSIQEQGKDLIAATKANAPKMTEQELVNAIQLIDDQLKDPLRAAALIITEPLNNGLSNLDKTQRELKRELALLRANNMPATGTAAGAAIEEGRRSQGTAADNAQAAARFTVDRLGVRIQTLQQRLEYATANGHTRTAERLRAKLDELKQRQQATTQRMAESNAKLNTSNARLLAIQRKKTMFSTRITVSTSVSVRDQQKAVAYRARMARTTIAGIG